MTEPDSTSHSGVRKLLIHIDQPILQTRCRGPRAPVTCLRPPRNTVRPPVSRLSTSLALEGRQSASWAPTLPPGTAKLRVLPRPPRARGSGAWTVEAEPQSVLEAAFCLSWWSRATCTPPGTPSRGG